MEKSRLIAVLETFSSKEIRAFRKFLQTSYFNQRADLILLYDVLAEKFLKKGILPAKEDVFALIYPKQAYDAQQLRQIMSMLLKLIEQFLVIKQMLGDEADFKLKLAKIYQERDLVKPLKSTLRELKGMQAMQSYRDATYYEKNYKLMLQEYSLTAANRIGEQNLQQISDNMDMAFILSKLRQSCNSLTHQTVYKTNYEFGLLDAILRYIKEQKLDQIPAVAVYYYCYHTLANPQEEQYFFAFRAHLFENEQLFQAEELRDLYLLAINYCIRRLNQGEMQYAKEGLDWYKRGLASGGLLTDGILSRFTYRNIVAMGLKVGDFEWVQSFIYEYKPLLEKQHRESMFTFNLAKLAYHRKQYQEALNLLRKAKYKDLLLNLAAKTLLLKTYYELEEWDMLESHLEAMQNYLRRKKVMGYHQTNYKNLIHYTKKLVSVSPYNKTAKEGLEKRLGNEEILTEREWLLGQLRLL